MMIHTTAIALFVLSLGAAPIVAQSFVQPTGYDGTAEKPIAGTIKAVVTLQDAAGTVGVHLDLQTVDGLVSVHIAPAMFMGQNNFWFYAGDQVEIIGTRTLHDGNAAVWAKAIQKGRTLLEFRNADGTPKWMPATDGADGCGVNHESLPRGTER
jgi:hypothetical protein